MQAVSLRNQYGRFLDSLEPTCVKIEQVLASMSDLRPQVPPLSPSIDKLCQVVSERVKTLKSILQQCSNVLDMFAQFCNLYKEVRVPPDRANNKLARS